MQPLEHASNAESLATLTGKSVADALVRPYGGLTKRSVMFEDKSIQRTEPDPPVRTLKIEADGDFWKGLTKPKIRLMGRWLERAGFSPGSHVHVTCVAPGIIELRSPGASKVTDTTPASSEESDRPF